MTLLALDKLTVKFGGLTAVQSVDCAIDSKQIVDANGWKTVLLVSDGFHMLRANWIFQHYGLDVSLSPVSVYRIIRSRPLYLHVRSRTDA